MRIPEWSPEACCLLRARNLEPNEQARNSHCSLFLLSLFLCLLFLRPLFLGVKAPWIAKFILFIIVPDPGSQDRDVVLVSTGLLGKPKRGVGNLELGGDEEGMRKGRSVCEQPGTKVDRVASRQRRVSK